MKKVCFLVLLACINVIANAQNIYTIAGGIGYGYSGDGGQATLAQLGLMQGPITKDASGNIYIPDFNNQRIRKVSVSTGIITTIAGTGTAGYNGDTIQAKSAQLSYPGVVSLDAAGNIYIGEYGGYRIRKIVASTGLIYTLIGNGSYSYNGNNIQAASATTKEIGGMALDVAGNIYYSDMGNHIIRKIIASTGLVTTVAGTAGTAGFSGDGGQATAAELNYPYAIALDASENIYIADRQNNRIRKVDAITGIISTVAGMNNTSDYNGDGILATAADLNGPWGLALDATGNLYIADSDNFRIRKVNSSGIISTIAGNGIEATKGDWGSADSSEVGRPFGVYVDPCGAVYITQYGGTSDIREVAPYNIATLKTNASCNGKCDGSINVSASGGSGPYTYAWNNGLAAGETETAVCSGTYILQVTDANQCQLLAHVTISQPAAISLQATSTSASCINEGTAHVSVYGGTAPYTYTWSAGSTSSSASGLSAGDYSVMVTDNNSCTASKTITVDPNIIHITFANINPTCQGNGSAKAAISGGTPGYTYTWSPTGTHTLTLNGLSSGHYTLAVTDTNGCVTSGVDILSSDSIIFPSAPICMVTVDSLSQHNTIIWDKTAYTNIDSFIVYRETSTNAYSRIGSQPYSALSEFIDTVRTLYFPNAGNPNAGTYRYKIQMHDTCGNYSQLSPYHNTIYILNTNGTFYWPQLYSIENGANPVNDYVLLRDDSTTGNWQVVGSVAGTQQTINDPLYAVYQNTASWRIQTLWNITCTPTFKLNANQTTGIFNTSYSNTYKNAATGIQANKSGNNIQIYPNPANGNFSIETNTTETQSIQVFDVNGKLVISQSIQGKANIDATNLNNGIYNISLLSMQGIVNKRLIIAK